MKGKASLAARFDWMTFGGRTATCHRYLIDRVLEEHCVTSGHACCQEWGLRRLAYFIFTPVQDSPTQPALPNRPSKPPFQTALPRAAPPAPPRRFGPVTKLYGAAFRQEAGSGLGSKQIGSEESRLDALRYVIFQISLEPGGDAPPRLSLKAPKML